MNEPGNVHEIENVLVQKYNPVNFDNDIALIKVNEMFNIVIFFQRCVGSFTYLNVIPIFF